MTDQEKAIVMAHTGICMLTGDKFQIFHKYVEDIMGRPIMIHEIGYLEDDIKKKSKADFITLCAEQEPRKGYISIDDVMSVFDDFMCGEVDENGTETFLEMLKDKAAESEDEE